MSVAPALPGCVLTAIYPVDKVMLPASSLMAIPGTSVQEALDILLGSGAPAPAPGPDSAHHHHMGMVMDMDMDDMHMSMNGEN